MRLLDLTLQNFRQFYGTQTIEFAGADPGRNITVLHGFNGAGKTALLNAFVWCLYGETTPDLEAPDKLTSERARDEAAVGDQVEVSVTIRFEMHDERYRVTRARRSTKAGPSELTHPHESLELMRTSESGETTPVASTDELRQRRIEQFLPRALYPFFFFNGERVERLAAPDAYDRVEVGVKTLLDIAVYERGADHLRRMAVPDLTKQLREHGDKELRDAVDKLEDLETEQQVLRETHDLHVANLAALSDQIDTAERQQSQLQELHELTRDREELRRENRSVAEQISEARRELVGAISRDGYLAFASGAIGRTSSLIAEARSRGEIPAKIKPQFVDDLLERQVCICQRPLRPGEEPSKALLAWRQTTGLADLEERINYTSSLLTLMADRRARMLEAHDDAQGKLARLYHQRSDLNQRLAVIDERLGDREFGDQAAELQGRIVSLRREREQESARKIVAEEKLQRNEEGRSALHREIDRLQVKGDKAALIKAQLQACEHVADAFDEVAKIQADDVRRSLDQQIGEIWRDAAIKDYNASITAQYQLLLTKEVGGQPQPVVGASTGEKQVVALSFVGSLVKKARENASIVHGVRVGGHYPLVMDSPFGALEDTYRRKVAEWVPSLADQVVVMVSRSQWRHEVEAAMRGRVGREYILELHTPKAGAAQSIEIQGADFPYVVTSRDPVEQTVIRKVS